MNKDTSQLIITKDSIHLELDYDVHVRANDFGVWFWEDFYSIDAKIISNTEEIDLSKYSRVFEDFNNEPILNDRLF